MTLALLAVAYLALFAAVAAWAWAVTDTLRRNRETFWFWLMALVPPLSVPVYVVNFYILGDEQRGLAAWRRAAHNAADRRELSGRLRTGDTLTISERYRLTEAFEAENRFQEALEVLAPALDTDPEDLRLQHLAARIFLQLGDLPRARSHAAYVIENDIGYANGASAVLWLHTARETIPRAEFLKVLLRTADKSINSAAFASLAQFFVPSDPAEIRAAFLSRAEAYLDRGRSDPDAAAALRLIRRVLR